nr:hypothetical protein BaRGS_025764 [Batillaria attramentaria]
MTTMMMMMMMMMICLQILAACVLATFGTVLLTASKTSLLYLWTLKDSVPAQSVGIFTAILEAAAMTFFTLEVAAALPVYAVLPLMNVLLLLQILLNQWKPTRKRLQPLDPSKYEDETMERRVLNCVASAFGLCVFVVLASMLVVLRVADAAEAVSLVAAVVALNVTLLLGVVRVAATVGFSILTATMGFDKMDLSEAPEFLWSGLRHLSENSELVHALVIHSMTSILACLLTRLGAYYTATRSSMVVPTVASTVLTSLFFMLDCIGSLHVHLGLHVCDLSNSTVAIFVVSVFLWLIPFLSLRMSYFEPADILFRPEIENFLSISYNSVCFDQNLFLNYNPFSIMFGECLPVGGKQSRVFICTTMYREADYEMEQLLRSLSKVSKSKKLKNANVYLESHIFLDNGADGFTLKEFALQLMSLVETCFSVARAESTIHKTPCGIQITCVLPGGMPLFLHLKDPSLVKAKKRWSQVMYMKYILDHRIRVTANRGGVPATLGAVHLNMTGKDAADLEDKNSEILVKIRTLLDGLKAEGETKIDKDKNSIIESRDGSDQSSDQGIDVADEISTISDSSSQREAAKPQEDAYIPDDDEENPPKWLPEFMSKYRGASPVNLNEDDPLKGLQLSSSQFEDLSEPVVFCISDGVAEEEKTFTSVQMENDPVPGSYDKQTYILATDADMLFNDAAVLDLVNVCNEDLRLGAACGRTYPMGKKVNPIVWYQIFEYAKGEDRWMCTLMMMKGWKLRYSTYAVNSTYCPDTVGEFIKQRRRWILSDFANSFLVFRNLPRLMRSNGCFSFMYAVYLVQLFIIVVFSPGTTVVMLTVRVTKCAIVVLGLSMAAVVIGAGVYVLIDMIKSINLGGLSLIEHYLLLALTGSLVYAALIHPRECYILVYGVVYLFYFPAMYMLLPLYALCNIVDQSWGTRDNQKAKVPKLICFPRIRRRKKKKDIKSPSSCGSGSQISAYGILSGVLYAFSFPDPDRGHDCVPGAGRGPPAGEEHYGKEKPHYLNGASDGEKLADPQVARWLVHRNQFLQVVFVTVLLLVALTLLTAEKVAYIWTLRAIAAPDVPMPVGSFCSQGHRESDKLTDFIKVPPETSCSRLRQYLAMAALLGVQFRTVSVDGEVSLNCRRLGVLYLLFKVVSVCFFIGLDVVVYGASDQTALEVAGDFFQHFVEVRRKDLLVPILLSILSGIFSHGFAYLSSAFCQPVFGILIPSLLSTIVSIVLCVGFFGPYVYQVQELTHFGEVLPLVITTCVVAVTWGLAYVLRTLDALRKPRYLFIPYEDVLIEYGWCAGFSDQRRLLSFCAEGATRDGFLQQPMRAKKSRVYVCTTMYREADYEMERLLMSFQRLSSGESLENVYLEAHIFMDNDTRCLLAPYGMQLTCFLPGGMPLFVHLKDPAKVKPKKRWSQCMYINYIMNFRKVLWSQDEDFNAGRLRQGGDSKIFFISKQSSSDKLAGQFSCDPSRASSSRKIGGVGYPTFSEFSQGFQQNVDGDDQGFVSVESGSSSTPSPSRSVDGSETDFVRETVDPKASLCNLIDENGDCGAGLDNPAMTRDDSSPYDIVEIKNTGDEMAAKATMPRSDTCYEFKFDPEEEIDDEHTYILATDADMDFEPEAVAELLRMCNNDRRLGAACGRTHPIGKHVSSIVWHQIFEYAKALALRLYRASAIRQVMDKYATPTRTPFTVYVKDTGEDRWMATLMMINGWRLRYSAFADNTTYCPDTFQEFFKQRRRWILSDIANLILVVQNMPRLLRNNECFSFVYLVYLFNMFMNNVITPGTAIVMITAGMELVFEVPYIYTTPPMAALVYAYAFMCTRASTHVQGMVTSALTVFLGSIFVSVAVWGSYKIVDGMVSELSKGHFQFQQHYIILMLTVSLLYAALSHPRESYQIAYGMAYLFIFPAMHLLLPIYSIANIIDQSWGTRDSQEAKIPKLKCIPNIRKLMKMRKKSKTRLNVIEDNNVDIQEMVNAMSRPMMEGNAQERDENAFWENLRERLLGNDVNRGLEREELANRLEKLRNRSLLGVMGINAVWLALLSYFYVGTDSPLSRLNLYGVISGALYGFTLVIQVIGMTICRVNYMLRKFAWYLYGDRYPMWVCAKNKKP